MKPILWLFLISAAFFLDVGTSTTFPELALTSRAEDESWKRRNDKGNRYEGLVSVQTGNPDLEVLSFTGFFEPFNRNVNLRVKFFLPGKTNLSIIAREIEEQKQYRMEAKPQGWTAGEWNEFSPWPTDVVLREGISSDNVGVLITIDQNQSSDQSTQLAPAFVYYSQEPHNSSSYLMYPRSNKNLRRVQLSLYGPDSSSRPRTWALGPQAADVPFRVNLDTQGFPEGKLTLKVDRDLRGIPQRPPTHEYSFYHKAN